MAAPTATGLAVTMELFQFAVDVQAQRYRREHPHADEDAVRSFVREWLLQRPGAPYGDAVGRSVQLAPQ